MFRGIILLMALVMGIYMDDRYVRAWEIIRAAGNRWDCARFCGRGSKNGLNFEMVAAILIWQFYVSF